MMWLMLSGYCFKDVVIGFPTSHWNFKWISKPIHNVEVIEQKGKRKEVEMTTLNLMTKIKNFGKLVLGIVPKVGAKVLENFLLVSMTGNWLLTSLKLEPEVQDSPGYGWISQGDKLLSKTFLQIVDILNRRSSNLLSHLDILDIVNWVGTVLSSRRSAEICLLDYNNPEWEDFAKAKKDHFNDNPQRSQSNNSLVFHQKPTKAELHYIFKLMEEAGGSEPGFINAETAKEKQHGLKVLTLCRNFIR